ncbi:transcriptional regulator [Herbaspirillum sp. NPDC087042]|uniref:transcriptional regulator n=1 Tax=Herbaspirillum sp. NPDC087042 TaxID=3364004 RepID=UPI00382C6834
MPTLDERKAFAERLKAALRRSPEPIKGPTDLALRFNLRYEGRSVSAQTAHNWLAGRSIPDGPKLNALAEWLKVDEHWLHYGPPPSKGKIKEKKKPLTSVSEPSDAALHLASRIEELPAQWRYMIEEFVERLHQDITG